MKNILFYDGLCPLCAKEIDLLRHLTDSSLLLIDIHSADCTVLGAPKTTLELLSALHLKSADNHWHSGVDASVIAWGHTPYGWIFLPLRWPMIKPAINWLYYKWASRRACKLGYIADSQAIESK